ncbi:hypothetical protein JTB14_022848 [Gonioctena quinquepunctata]|nr:hypothetical protein JTB14_022848 [Gonioctena quinquepunctata]
MKFNRDYSVMAEFEREQEYLEMLAQEMYNESDEDVNEDILEVRCEKSDSEQDLTDEDDHMVTEQNAASEEDNILPDILNEPPYVTNKCVFVTKYGKNEFIL